MVFDHSVKVPRLYKEAAKVLKATNEGHGSVKQLVYTAKHPNIKAIYSLVLETIRYRNELELIFKKSKFLIKEDRLDPYLAKIITTELLWGKKKLPIGGGASSKPLNTILAYEQIFKAHLSDSHQDTKTFERAQDRGGPNNSNHQPPKPRYVRVNTIKTSVNDVIYGFRDDGWILNPTTHSNTTYQDFLGCISKLEGDFFTVDMHLPNLLIFPPKTEFYRHPAYKTSSIMLQDKASCLPVHILAPPVGGVVLDMCAAPGMKTTQIAAAVGAEGTVYAVEMDQRRFSVLNKMVEDSGAAPWVRTINRDVLNLTGDDLKGVEYILVDPSCTGSGITDRLDVGSGRNEKYVGGSEVERIKKLAGFQIKILRHALQKFPSVKRVVYSTCSVNEEENEGVVRQVLETCGTFKLVSAIERVGGKWGKIEVGYGSKNAGGAGGGRISELCLNARAEVDLTNGFFVALLERLEEGEVNEFYNRSVGRLQKKMEKNKDKEKVEAEDGRKGSDVSNGRNVVGIEGGNESLNGGGVYNVFGGNHLTESEILGENSANIEVKRKKKKNRDKNVEYNEDKVQNNELVNEVSKDKGLDEEIIKKTKRNKKKKVEAESHVQNIEKLDYVQDSKVSLDKDLVIDNDDENISQKKIKKKKKKDKVKSTEDEEDVDRNEGNLISSKSKRNKKKNKELEKENNLEKDGNKKRKKDEMERVDEEIPEDSVGKIHKKKKLKKNKQNDVELNE